MTRKEEIEKAAISATGSFINTEWFITGARWADEHPDRNVFLKSVCSWIKINAQKYHKSGVFHVDEFIKDLNKAMGASS